MMKARLFYTLLSIFFSMSVFSQKTNVERVSYHFKEKKLDYLIAIDKEKCEQKIEAGKDRYLLIDFSIPGCKGCIKEIPKISECCKMHNDKLEVVMLWSCADYKLWMWYAEKLQLDKQPFSYLLDEKGVAINVLDVNVFPTYMLFNQDGLLVKSWRGRFPKKIEKYLK